MAVNGVYIVLGEANTIVALLNKARRQFQLSHQPPSLEDTDPLLRNFSDLKEVLNAVADLADMNPLTYLSPFLDVIKAENTNGPITEASLSSVAKFLSYGLIDASSIKTANAVESIAYSVVQTKFIGGKNSSSDECVLFKILHVLRSLLLSPPGSLLSNEAVCDLMQSCFRIVFELGLSPLLRKAAEATLTDMTQLIFTRLPTFHEDTRHPYIRKLVMNAKGEKRKRRRRPAAAVENVNVDTDLEDEDDIEVVTAIRDVTEPLLPAVEPTATEDGNTTGIELAAKATPTDEKADEADSESGGDDNNLDVPLKTKTIPVQREVLSDDDDVTNKETVQMPYGLPCCRELLRFMIALTNPLDRNNTESMVVLGLNLITVALEAAADHLASYSLLLPLIRDNLCRSLLQLLDTEKLPVLAATNRACFLLFESMRVHLKFQLESYLYKLKAIVISAKPTTSYEQKQMALESIINLWRIPGLVTELYLNYDCDLYCSNVFEELTKLLADMSFPISEMGPSSILSLDALLVVLETIEQNCVCRQAGNTMADGSVQSSQRQAPLELPSLSGYEVGKKLVDNTRGLEALELSETSVSNTTVAFRANRHSPANLPSMADVLNRKEQKRILAEGTELFNNSPKDGINFLREKGLLDTDPQSVVAWLRSNPQLDKKKIADYICSRKNANVLEAFVQSFPFEGTRLDEALRIFLETFRLPGEAAEISMVMQHFSEQWYKANHEPFNHPDAAFTLSYGIIMLNMDQHNPMVKRNQPTMTVNCFKRNLSGTNGSKDFDPEMLEKIYNSIKSEEIVMPAEQTGIVKENYLWKVLLRRGDTSEGQFLHAPTGWNDHALYSLVWGPAIASLSYVFSKTDHIVVLKRTINGYRKCASIASHFGMKNVFDNLVIHLCKFSKFATGTEGGHEQSLELVHQRNAGGQLTSADKSSDLVSKEFASDEKAVEAIRLLFDLVHQYGDILHEGWRNIVDVLLNLFKAKLLPPQLTEVDDFTSEKGWVSIVRNHAKNVPQVRADSGLLSWFGLGGGGSVNVNDETATSAADKELIQKAYQLIGECKVEQLVTDSKYLTSSTLLEFVEALVHTSRNIATSESSEAEKKKAALSAENEDALVFYLELMVLVALENKDRLLLLWPNVYQHLQWLLSARFGRCPVLVERAVVGLLRIANRNLFRDDTVNDSVLQSLALLLRLSPKAVFILSRQIAYGLYELLSNNAANIHRKEHWDIIFALMEAAGAASIAEEFATNDDFTTSSIERNAYSDTERGQETGGHLDERGYTSDNSQLTKVKSKEDTPVGQSREWIHLDHDADKATEDALKALGGNSQKRLLTRGSPLVLKAGLGRHEPAAFLKVADCLAFLLRDAAHVTPENLDASVECLRTMMEACIDGGRYSAGPLPSTQSNLAPVESRKATTKTPKNKDLSTDVGEEQVELETTDDQERELTNRYQQVSLQLLDLCANLHKDAPGILQQWAAAQTEHAQFSAIPVVWDKIWKPLLQAMARLSCDCRRFVRSDALNRLQRAFLPVAMASLGSREWESCFSEVLYPLLEKLVVDQFSPMDIIGMEDTRVRAVQIVCKTLLNHLNTLASLPSFPTLWLKLLDFMEQYLLVDNCGNLKEAIPESLKNMLLVLDNTGLFASIPGLYDMTTSKMSSVLPQLIRDVIPNPPSQTMPANQPMSSGGSSLIDTNAKMTSRVQIAAAIPSEPQPQQTVSPSQTYSPSHAVEQPVWTNPTSSLPSVSSTSQQDMASPQPSSEAISPHAPVSPHTYQHEQQQQPANVPVNYGNYGQTPADYSQTSVPEYNQNTTATSVDYGQSAVPDAAAQAAYNAQYMQYYQQQQQLYQQQLQQYEQQQQQQAYYATSGTSAAAPAHLVHNYAQNLPQQHQTHHQQQVPQQHQQQQQGHQPGQQMHAYYYPPTHPS